MSQIASRVIFVLEAVSIVLPISWLLSLAHLWVERWPLTR
jgi:hypothetical protein